MSVYWRLGGIDWFESRLALGSILKLLLAIAGGNFPIFVVMFPWNKSRWLIKWKTDPKDLGMLIKTTHQIQLRLFNLYLWNLWVKFVHKSFDGGDRQKCLSGKVLIYWTSAIVLGWVLTTTGTSITADYSVDLQGFLNLFSHPVLSTR